MVNVGKSTSEYKLTLLAIGTGGLLSLAGVALMFLHVFGYGAALLGYVALINGAALVLVATVTYGRWRATLKKETIKAITASPKRV